MDQTNHKDGFTTAVEPPEPLATMTIVLHKDGRIQIQAPYERPELCFLMLRMADFQIMATITRPPVIQKPSPADINHLKK